jgi:glucokinase
MGVVGPVDVEAGVLSSSPEFAWRDVPLRALLHEATGLPIVVDSGRRGMALAEMMFGLGQGVRNFMLVHVGSTIVAGIVADQQLYRGASGGGGAIGHLAISGAPVRCRCGRLGCLDMAASEEAMEARALELARLAPESGLARALSADDGKLTRHRLYDAARAGDPVAGQILEEAARQLGEGIANVLSVLDPELVLIGGEVVEVSPIFVETIRAVVEASAYRAADGAIRVLPSTFGRDLRLFGGLALALHDLFYAPSLTLPAANGSVHAAGG